MKRAFTYWTLRTEGLLPHAVAPPRRGPCAD